MSKMISADATMAVIVALSVVQLTNGHGRLLDPPGRSSMWRLGFSTPKNYDDNALFCGGFSNQYEKQNGRCGICGDPYQGPHDNEAGGIYATGTISRKYTQGQVIDVTVEVTANHLGWFEFKLCPNNNPLRAATRDCLDQHVLQRADGSGTKLFIGRAVGRVNLKVRLSDDVTCSQCVFQWRWHTGNSYGIRADGTSCLGCGNQEEFYGCSDIEITPAGNHHSSSQGHQSFNFIPGQHTSAPRPPITTVTPQPASGLGQGGSGLGQGILGLGLGNTGSGQTRPIVGLLRCHAISALWRNQPQYDTWCRYHCLTLNKCPQTLCACV